jgi:hypothetical protein
MRSRSFARVVIAGLAVSVVITLGCGKPPSAPSGAPTPTPGPEPSASQRLAALALFEAASVHAGVMTSLLTYGTDYGKVLWTNQRPLPHWTRFNAGLPRWRFGADSRNVLANRQPHVCGVFQQLSGELLGGTKRLN